MSASLEPIPEDECRKLIASRALGRLGLTAGALPVVLPVNYAFGDDLVVVRTEHGHALAAARARQVVCLQVDEIEPVGHTGWSVMVTGILRELTGEHLEAAQRLPLVPWGRPNAPYWLGLPVELVTGRRVVHTGG